MNLRARVDLTQITFLRRSRWNVRPDEGRSQAQSGKNEANVCHAKAIANVPECRGVQVLVAVANDQASSGQGDDAQDGLGIVDGKERSGNERDCGYCSQAIRIASRDLPNGQTKT